MKTWTRRSLLAGGVIVALPVASVTVGKLACHLAALPKTAGAGLNLLSPLYRSSPGVRSLGEAYLRQTKSTAAACLHRLNAHDQITEALESGSRTATLSAIDLACRADFRAGRIHLVNGWVLAQTELDIAALATT
jgi:hypothetical protein